MPCHAAEGECAESAEVRPLLLYLRPQSPFADSRLPRELSQEAPAAGLGSEDG